VPESCLHGPDVVPRFEPMGRTRVPNRRTPHRLGDLRRSDSGLHRPLPDPCVDVMPPDDPRPRIPQRLGGREDLWPRPLTTGVGVFTLQRIRQVHVPSAHLQILRMPLVDVVEMPRSGRFDRLG
jgi:hypothetical protein